MTTHVPARIPPVLFFTLLVLGMSAGLLGPSLQDLTDQTGIQLDDGGALPSLMGVGASITILLYGWLYERYNARWLLTSGAALLGTGLLVVAAAASSLVLLVGVFVFGLGFGSVVIGPQVVVAALNPTRAAGPLNRLNVLFGVGAVIGPQVVNIAFSIADYRLAFAITGLSTLALTPWLWRVAIEPVQDGGKAVRGAVPWLALLPFGLLLFIYVGTEVGFGVWIATQITLVAEASESTGAVAASLFWFGVAAGRLIASQAARGLSPEMLLIATLSVLASGTILLLAVPGSAAVALISALVVGLGCGPVFPTVLAAVSDNYPAYFRVASGALVSFGNFGAVVVPWLQGKVGDGVSGGMSVTLTLGLVMLLLALTIRARHQPQAA